MTQRQPSIPSNSTGIVHWWKDRFKDQVLTEYEIDASKMASRSGEEAIKVICVPTEAGTHFPGQCKAPEALIKTGGLVEKLESVGYEVFIQDRLQSDPAFTKAASWSPSPKVNGVRNEMKTLAVMNWVREYILSTIKDMRDIPFSPGDDFSLMEDFPIVLGGDCSITPAILSGLSEVLPAGVKYGLLYIDGDADLTLPAQTDSDGSTAIMDSMCITHLTGRPGGLESMRAFSRPDGKPLINPDNIVLFGFDPLQPSPEHWTYLLENQYNAFTRPTVQANSVGCAKDAVAWLSERVDVIFVHFDVDVIDSGEFPLANYPHYNGLGIDQAMAVLDQVLSAPKVRSLTVTEVNPNNDVDGIMVKRVVDGIVHGMTRRKLR